MALSHEFIKSLDIDYSSATGEAGSVRNPLLSLYISIMNENIVKEDISLAESFGIVGLVAGKGHRYDNLFVFNKATNNYYANLKRG